MSPPKVRQVLWIVALVWAGSSGCIHNHYYGTGVPGCPPALGPTITTQGGGSICDVPSGSSVVSTPSTRSISSKVADTSTDLGPAAPPNDARRIVISQPATGPPSAGQVSNRFKWRKPDPEALPPLKAEGGLDESVVR